MNTENEKEKHAQWHQDPSNWKFGIFYFNKDDHRILPPKRIKLLGWTLNFAHWQAYAILVFLILLIVYLNQLS